MSQLIPRVLQDIQEFLARITRNPAWAQKPIEVFIREPGHKCLEGPRPIISEVKKHQDFAWLSVVAYGRSPRGDNTFVDEAARKLKTAGWEPWENFPGDELTKKFKHAHLRSEIWEKKHPPSVAVAFGGTVFGNILDWRSNLRWLLRKLPTYTDEYTEIVNDFGPAFVEEFEKQIKRGRDHLREATIYATGHSLGGGLAQQLAYALPTGNAVPRIRQVHAFDPSPVTGFFSVKREVRNVNKLDLSIDRTYERGEVLATLRSITSLIFPPSARDPSIRGVRYNLFFTWNPISGHSIEQLARRLEWADNHPELPEPPPFAAWGRIPSRDSKARA